MPNVGSFKEVTWFMYFLYRMKILHLYERDDLNRKVKAGYLNQYNPLSWLIVGFLCLVMFYEMIVKKTKFKDYQFKELFTSNKKMKADGFHKL